MYSCSILLLPVSIPVLKHSSVALCPGRPVSPVKGFCEETGRSVEPAAIAIFFSCGAGNRSISLRLWALLFFWEVIWQSWVLRYFHSSRVQRDINLMVMVWEEGELKFLKVKCKLRCSVFPPVDLKKSSFTSSPASFFTICWADNTLVAAMAVPRLYKWRHIKKKRECLVLIDINHTRRTWPCCYTNYICVIYFI